MRGGHYSVIEQEIELEGVPSDRFSYDLSVQGTSTAVSGSKTSMTTVTASASAAYRRICVSRSSIAARIALWSDIPTRYLFRVTTVLITFLAAGLAAQSVQFFQQAGLLRIWEWMAWDTSGILSDTSLFGRLLHTKFGYNDQPSELQVLVYLATLSIIFALTKLFEPAGPVYACKSNPWVHAD